MRYLLGGLGQSGAEFEEDGEVVASHDSVAVGVDLEPPAEPVDVQRRGVHGRRRVLQLREVAQRKRAAVVARDDFTARGKKRGFVNIYSFYKFLN